MHLSFKTSQDCIVSARATRYSPGGVVMRGCISAETGSFAKAQAWSTWNSSSMYAVGWKCWVVTMTHTRLGSGARKARACIVDGADVLLVDCIGDYRFDCDRCWYNVVLY